MKEDAILYFGSFFYYPAVTEMEVMDVEMEVMDVVIVYGSSSFYSAAVMEMVTESAVSKHHQKAASLRQLFL